MTKAKSFLLSVIIALTYLSGIPELLVSVFGPVLGIVLSAYIALVLSLIVLYWKIRYNTVTGPGGWTTKIIILNSCTGLLLAIGIVNQWAGEHSVTLNGGFLDVMSKITIFANFAINGLTFGWDSLKQKTLDSLNEPVNPPPSGGIIN